jgi:inner membrane protein
VDNLTHSLAGMLVAEAACTLRRKQAPPELRAKAYLLSVLANNLPDIDVFYAPFIGPKPFGNLMHHRGHTHTLLLASAGAWLLWRGALALWRRRRQPLEAAPARLLLGLCLLGPVLHLSMDFGNNYGVHPFWPLSGRWFYGDSIFIVEPLWWALTIPALAHALRVRWLKLLLWGALLALLVVCWYVPFVLPASRVALLGLSAGGFALTRFGSARQRLAYAGLGSLAVAGVFAFGSAQAKAALRRAGEAQFPALEVRDIAATPMPANPVCWEGLVVGEQGGTYRVLRASVALPPLSAAGCTAGDDVKPTAEVTWLDRPDRDGVHWLNEYRAELSELRRLRQDDCRFRALLQWSRLPYVRRGSTPGEALRAGDLRYDRTPGADFSDVQLAPAMPGPACPRFVSSWREPRWDLFQR